MRLHHCLPITILLGFSLCLAPSVYAQDVAAAARANKAKKETEKSLTLPSQWGTLTHAVLQMHADEGDASVQFEMNPNGDLRIKTEATEKGKHISGEIMLIKGQRIWLLAKQVPMEKGYEIDYVDGPLLQLKIALAFLDRALPDGPGAIQEKRMLEVKESSRPISVSTPSASGEVSAPWSLQGSIEPAGAGRWSFDLDIRSEEVQHLQGIWEKRAEPPFFGDDLPLDGWEIFTVGPLKREEGNSTIFDYGAQAFATKVKTLGELRKL